MSNETVGHFSATVTQKGDAKIANPFAEEARALGLTHSEGKRAVAEIQAAMVLARQFPRDPKVAMDRILNDCARPKLAEAGLYEYSRGGTPITGPTIRLAECMAQHWGNLRVGVVELSRGRTDGRPFSEAKAYAWDLETGFYDERIFQVPHWRDTREGGYLLTDERDIYEAVANAGARRKRAAILAVLPGDVVEAAEKQCTMTLKTKAEVTEDSLRLVVEAFSEFRVTKEQLETWLQRRLDAMTPAQMVRLRRIYASLKDGMSEPRDWFKPKVEDFPMPPQGEPPPLTDPIPFGDSPTPPATAQTTASGQGRVPAQRAAKLPVTEFALDDAPERPRETLARRIREDKLDRFAVDTFLEENALPEYSMLTENDAEEILKQYSKTLGKLPRVV
jgi:hypothetical protein